MIALYLCIYFQPSQIYRAQGSVFTRRPFGTMRSLTKVKIGKILSLFILIHAMSNKDTFKMF